MNISKRYGLLRSRVSLAVIEARAKSKVRRFYKYHRIIN